MNKAPTGDSYDFQVALETARVYIPLFEQRYGVCLVGVHETSEAGILEPSFVFTDGFGGYTLDGLISSLLDG